MLCNFYIVTATNPSVAEIIVISVGIVFLVLMVPTSLLLTLCTCFHQDCPCYYKKHALIRGLLECCCNKSIIYELSNTADTTTRLVPIVLLLPHLIVHQLIMLQTEHDNDEPPPPYLNFDCMYNM